jgi:hypothetical protein
MRREHQTRKIWKQCEVGAFALNIREDSDPLTREDRIFRTNWDDGGIRGMGEWAMGNVKGQ